MRILARQGTEPLLDLVVKTRPEERKRIDLSGQYRSVITLCCDPTDPCGDLTYANFMNTVRSLFCDAACRSAHGEHIHLRYARRFGASHHKFGIYAAAGYDNQFLHGMEL
jgi:hypothetical protein